jgi:hypothetical protein
MEQMQRFLCLGFLFFLMMACRNAPHAPSQNRASVYRPGSLVTSQPIQPPAPILPGAPDLWICAQPGLDSLFKSDSMQQTFVLRWTWEQKTFALARFMDSRMVIFHVQSEKTCTPLDTLYDIPMATSVHGEDINQDQQPELWCMGMADKHGNVPTNIFFLKNNSLIRLELALHSPEVMHEGRGLVSRYFDHRCAISHQEVYFISPEGRAKLKESLTFRPNCAVDSAQAILSYPGDMEKSMALPIVGTRRMVFDIFKSFYE